MGLQEEIEETKKQLAELDKQPEKDPEEPALVPEEEAEAEVVEGVVEDKPAEEAEKELEVPNPTAADFARMRREKKALERELAEAKAKPAPTPEKEKSVEAVTSDDPEPDRATKYEQWLEWNLREHKREIAEIKGTVSKSTRETEHERLISQAVEEFNGYERDFKAIEPTYDDAAKFYTQELGRSIKMLNPGATPAQIGTLIKNTVLQKAAGYAKRGLDPAEELFNEAVSIGFAAKKVEDNPEEEDQPKANLSRVAANRARNAGTAAAKGRGAPQLTREVAANYSNVEWAKLSTSEKKRLLGGAQ